MKSMDKAQAMEYVNGIEFGLKDFEKTKEKFGKYRKEVVLTMTDDYEIELERDLWDSRQDYRGRMSTIKEMLKRDGVSRS